MASGPSDHAVALRAARSERLFRSDTDRQEFIAALSEVLGGREGCCLAWALLPDRIELVLRGDALELGERLAELEAHYARGFNRRHRRRGYLFADPLELEPVPPRALRARICSVLIAPWLAGEIPSLHALEAYPWSSVGGLVGLRARRPFEATGTALGVLGPDRPRVRSALARAANAVRREFTA